MKVTNRIHNMHNRNIISILVKIMRTTYQGDKKIRKKKILYGFWDFFPSKA